MDDNSQTANTSIISQEEIIQNTVDSDINNNDKKNVPSNFIAIIFFIIVTTIFTIVVYTTVPSVYPITDSGNNTLYIIIYILVLVFGNYFINLNLTSSVCDGNAQWGSTMINTIIPWVFIFGVINIVLIIFPGWLSPFANTFGYLAMKALGLNDLLKTILDVNRDNNSDNLKGPERLVARGIQEIYSNNSLFINQISSDPQTFDNVINSLKETGYFIKDVPNNKIGELYKLIKLKEIVAKYIWNLLTGILVTSVSYNYVINSQCSNSLKQMQDRRNDFIVQEKNRQNSKQNNRVYYPFIIGDEHDVDVKSSSYGTKKNN